MDNAITVTFNPASADEKAAAEKTMKDMGNMKAEDMAKTGDEDEGEEPTGGVSGLASNLDVTVTLNDEKTTLVMVEDSETSGLYVGKFTPPVAGFPSVHVYTEIDGKPIEGTFHPEKVEDGAVIKTVTPDGTVNVNVVATAPTKDEGMLIKLEFTGADDMPIQHVNYNIVATQDGTEVLSESEAHTHTGEAEHSTNALSSANPVDIQVTILGIGLPDDKTNWSGPKDATVPVHVTPEFGPLVMAIFGIATVSIVGLVAKSKLIPKI
jgi:hypothetical protein